MKSKARSIALASAVTIDESSGIHCILLWLSDITMVYSEKLLNIIALMKCEDYHTQKATIGFAL